MTPAYSLSAARKMTAKTVAGVKGAMTAKGRVRAASATMSLSSFR
jgi:hypothetical protein